MKLCQLIGDDKETTCKNFVKKVFIFSGIIVVFGNFDIATTTLQYFNKNHVVYNRQSGHVLFLLFWFGHSMYIGIKLYLKIYV